MPPESAADVRGRFGRNGDALLSGRDCGRSIRTHIDRLKSLHRQKFAAQSVFQGSESDLFELLLDGLKPADVAPVNVGHLEMDLRP